MISWDEYNEEAANGASASATQAAPEVVSAAAPLRCKLQHPKRKRLPTSCRPAPM